MTPTQLRADITDPDPTAGPTVVLAFEGDLDLATATEITSRGLEAMRGADVREVVLDLSHVTFVDSTALSAFVQLRNEAQRLDLVLRLRGLSTRLHRVFAVTGLYDVFIID